MSAQLKHYGERLLDIALTQKQNLIFAVGLILTGIILGLFIAVGLSNLRNLLQPSMGSEELASLIPRCVWVGPTPDIDAVERRGVLLEPFERAETAEPMKLPSGITFRAPALVYMRLHNYTMDNIVAHRYRILHIAPDGGRTVDEEIRELVPPKVLRPGFVVDLHLRPPSLYPSASRRDTIAYEVYYCR